MKMPNCSQLMHLNGLVTPGGVSRWANFTADFCLTDLVLDPEDEGLHGGVAIWLTIPEVSSENLFKFFVDNSGKYVSLNSGILCPKGSLLTANGNTGATGNIKVMLTGYTC
ncbi:MAG TPA: hypothetical protein VGS07_34220 [Thermoanaerobaculia bacterium]|nr:hypothetical protein [Thermoanaerobaculia bacterium]